MNRRIPLAVTAAAAAVLLSAPQAPAETAHAVVARQTHAAPTVTHVRTVAAFDFAAGEAPENLTVNPGGSLTLSMLGSPAGRQPELMRLAPSGHRPVLATGQQGDTITGNTRGGNGTIYYNVASADADRAGVWKLPVGGSPRRIAALPTDALPNGLALAPSGRTLYVADSHKGTVWSVPVSGGAAKAWLTDPALEPTQAVPLGANGLRYHDGAVWVSNLSKSTLLRIPVTATGGPGTIHVVADDLTGVDDFSFLSEHCDVVFAALNGPNEIDEVAPDGTTTTVLTASDGLASPTATAVRGNRLYITDAGLNEPHDAKLQSAVISLGAPGGPRA